MDEMQRFADRRMAEYNDTPQPELGNLSPLQARAVLEDPWDGTGPLRITDDLPFDAFAAAEALGVLNAQRLLTIIADERRVRLTPAGYLPRAFVARMLEMLQWRPGYVEHVREGNRVINEMDVPPLLSARDVLMAARLLKTHRGALQVSRDGRALSVPERVGALAAILFRTWFRYTDIAADDRFRGGEEIQGQLPLVLRRLSQLDEAWRTTEELTDAVILPELRARWKAQAPIGISFLMLLRVFRPLCDFGLLVMDLDSYSLETERFRRTALFPRFLSWRFTSP
jgi:hypothetical protein